MIVDHLVQIPKPLSVQVVLREPEKLNTPVRKWWSGLDDLGSSGEGKLSVPLKRVQYENRTRVTRTTSECSATELIKPRGSAIRKERTKPPLPTIPSRLKRAGPVAVPDEFRVIIGLVQ